MNKKIRIGIVDDKAINRNSIADKIRQYAQLELCFTAVNGDDCLEQLKGLPLNKFPDLIFMDLEMPGLDGIQTISIARVLYPEIFFLVLTIFDDDDKIFDAIKAGAHGYLLKDETASALHSAILTTVEDGGAPMSAPIARRTLQLLSLGERPEATNNSNSEENFPGTVLSDREKEILQLIVNGYDAKRVAASLGISVFTIRKHIANIYQKLHVNNKAQVISLAHQKKWKL